MSTIQQARHHIADKRSLSEQTQSACLCCCLECCCEVNAHIVALIQVALHFAFGLPLLYGAY